MHWIAFLPPLEGERVAWGWHALQFTPRVAQAGEALVLEVSASERLWGGRERLLALLFAPESAVHPLPGGGTLAWAQGATSRVALALLRLRVRGQRTPLPLQLPQALPLDTLDAALPHVDTLARAGSRTWGDLRALPRGPVARRFGAGLLRALDEAFGDQPEGYPWLTLPEFFDVRLELPALATTTPELMWSAQRLLAQMQVWLQARQLGVLALELEWTLDLKRLNGVVLPPSQQLTVRTAQPAQDMVHLRRLVGEHLSRGTLLAPASHLRLRSLDTAPWTGASHSFLPEDNRPGDRLHELVERLSARLGAQQVVVPVAEADHRPERMQRWVSARDALPRTTSSAAPRGQPVRPADALYPPWMLPEPMRLDTVGDTPQYQGPLRKLSRAQRLESGWWDRGGEPAVRRDYYVAHSEGAGLVWIYEEIPWRLDESAPRPRSRWFLQGLYA